MKLQKTVKITGIVLAMSAIMSVYSVTAYSAAKSSTPSKQAKTVYEGKTDITGTVTIKVDVGKVKNLIEGDKNKSIIRLGSIKQSEIKGNVEINLNDIGNVTSTVRGSKNTAIMKIGSIENSKISGGTTKITVKAKNITNEILGGSNNVATLKVGNIENSDLKGGADINVDIKGDIKNHIYGGNKNVATIKIGGVENSRISGRLNITVNADEIINEIKSGSNSTQETIIGYVQ